MSNKHNYYHAFTIVKENCTGCTRCVSVCPTEALRVRMGKVVLDSDRCIDCARCIYACRYNAIVPAGDSLDNLKNYEYTVAIATPSLSGQFPANIGYAATQEAIKRLGFDEVISEARITSVVSELIRRYVRSQKIRPVLSSHCPAVLRLIQVRFTSLLPNILYVESPMNILARTLRSEIAQRTGIEPDRIGVFHISPCISQITAVHQPEGTSGRYIDHALAVRDVYKLIQGSIRKLADETPPHAPTPRGLSWAVVERETDQVDDGNMRCLSVSGIKNVFEILSKIENQQFHEPYDFVVLRNCIKGCVGGVLNIENPFVAASRIVRQLNTTFAGDDLPAEPYIKMYNNNQLDVGEVEPRPIMHLDDDIRAALEKMKKIKQITGQLPGLDCSACGSPSCQSLAEDIVSGQSQIEDCVVLHFRAMKNLHQKEAKHEA